MPSSVRRPKVFGEAGHAADMAQKKEAPGRDTSSSCLFAQSTSAMSNGKALALASRPLKTFSMPMRSVSSFDISHVVY